MYVCRRKPVKLVFNTNFEYVNVYTYILHSNHSYSYNNNNNIVNYALSLIMNCSYLLEHRQPCARLTNVRRSARLLLLDGHDARDAFLYIRMYVRIDLPRSGAFSGGILLLRQEISRNIRFNQVL